MPAPPARKLPKDYDKLPVPQPQATQRAQARPQDAGDHRSRASASAAGASTAWPSARCPTASRSPPTPRRRRCDVCHRQPRHLHRLHGLREVVPGRLRRHPHGAVRDRDQGPRRLRDGDLQRRAARQEDRRLRGRPRADRASAMNDYVSSADGRRQGQEPGRARVPPGRAGGGRVADPGARAPPRVPAREDPRADHRARARDHVPRAVDGRPAARSRSTAASASR